MLLCVLVLTSGSPVGGRITTRSEKLSDFPSKVTKVVLSGNIFQDTALKEAIRNSWTISPYEFCTAEEFSALCTDDSYYFLVRTVDPRKKGISFLTLAKGGEKDLEDMLQVFTMPVGAADSTAPDDGLFLTAMVGIMQEYILKGLVRYRVNISPVPGARKRLEGMNLFFSEGDLAPSVDRESLGRGMFAVAGSEAEEILAGGSYDTAVSYVIAPESPQKGDLCYKLMIDARTFELLYFGKHRISSSQGRGFLPRDIRTLAKDRK